MYSFIAPGTSFGVKRTSRTQLQAKRRTKRKRKEEVSRDSGAFSGSSSGPLGRGRLDDCQWHDQHCSTVGYRGWLVHVSNPAYSLGLFSVEQLLGSAGQGAPGLLQQE